MKYCCSFSCDSVTAEEQPAASATCYQFLAAAMKCSVPHCKPTHLSTDKCLGLYFIH